MAGVITTGAMAYMYMCMCNTWSGMASPSQKGRFGADAVLDLSISKLKLDTCHSGLSPKCGRSPTSP